MKLVSLGALAALALVVAGCGKKDAGTAAAPSGPVAAVAAPAGQQWTEVVSATPEGGFRMGNPNAPIKLVEYASFTCPHCKKFEEEGADALQKKYVSTGKVSWEFRSFLIHGPDPAVTLLMGCRGPAPFFKLSQQLYASQDDWLGKMVAIPEAQQQAIAKMPITDQFKALVEAGGLYGFLAARGLPRAQADACLADQKAIDAMTANQQRATDKDQVNATPTFLINGAQQPNVSTWSDLDAALGQMGA